MEKGLADAYQKEGEKRRKAAMGLVSFNRDRVVQLKDLTQDVMLLGTTRRCLKFLTGRYSLEEDNM